MRVSEANGQTLHAALGILPGVTAFVGGGGKTTAMLAIALGLSARGSVLVTTSTHIYPPDGMPVLLAPSEAEVQAALQLANCICIGTPEENGKLSSPLLPYSVLCSLFDYVLVEADGAKGMPLKAPAAHEPVLPADTELVIAVAGLDGIGRPILHSAFRPALYAAILGVDESHVITPEDVAMVLCDENGQYKAVHAPMRFSVLLNKADDPSRIATARRVVFALNETRVARAVIACCKEKERC